MGLVKSVVKLGASDGKCATGRCIYVRRTSTSHQDHVLSSGRVNVLLNVIVGTMGLQQPTKANCSGMLKRGMWLRLTLIMVRDLVTLGGDEYSVSASGSQQQHTKNPVKFAKRVSKYV